MSEAWAGGSTRRWRRIRAHVLDRDGHICRNQIATICTTTATHAHHTLGRSVTGDDPDYLVASCEPCNLHIGEPATHPDDCPLCTARQPTPRTEW